MGGRYVTRINGAYDTGGSREIQFGDYSRPNPNLSATKPPSVVVMERYGHRLTRSNMGGGYYDVRPCRDWWYLGKFQSERAAIVAWETHLRQRGVIV